MPKTKNAHPRNLLLWFGSALLVLLAACTDVPTVTSVDVTLSEDTVAVGDTVQATAVINTTTGVLTSGKINWQSQDATVATVSESGVVTGVADGTTNIVGSYDLSPFIMGSAEITVYTPEPPEPPEPTESSITIEFATAPFYLRGTRTASATVIVDDEPAPGATWTSSDPTVLSVDPATGEVSAVAVGTATITATSTVDASLSADLEVTVVHPFAGASVLFYQEDYSPQHFADNVLWDAHFDYGLDLTEVTNDDAPTDFPNAITQDPDLVFYELSTPGNMTGSHLIALIDWVADGGYLIFTVGDGTLDGREDLVANMGASIVDQRPVLSLNVVDPELKQGVIDSPTEGYIGVPPGYEVYIQVLEAAAGSAVWVDYGGTNPVAVAGNDERTVTLAFPQWIAANATPMETFYENLFVRMLRNSLEAQAAQP